MRLLMPKASFMVLRSRATNAWPAVQKMWRCYALQGRSYKWIEAAHNQVGHMLLDNYRPIGTADWRRRSTHELLVRPQHEALWAAQKEKAQRTQLPSARDRGAGKVFKLNFRHFEQRTLGRSRE